MPREKTPQEALEECFSDGRILEREDVDIPTVRRAFELALTRRDAASVLLKTMDRKSKFWSVIYSMYYEVVRDLTDIVVRFDKKNITNHRCLFAWMCSHHDLLDWAFCERIRTKRNGIHYHGEPASYDDWKEVEIQINLAITTLAREIERRLAEPRNSAV